MDQNDTITGLGAYGPRIQTPGWRQTSPRALRGGRKRVHAFIRSADAFCGQNSNRTQIRQLSGESENRLWRLLERCIEKEGTADEIETVMKVLNDALDSIRRRERMKTFPRFNKIRDIYLEDPQTAQKDPKSTPGHRR